jgi:hypothetical protein
VVIAYLQSLTEKMRLNSYAYNNTKAGKHIVENGENTKSGKNSHQIILDYPNPSSIS